MTQEPALTLERNTITDLPFADMWDADLGSRDPLDFPGFEAVSARDESLRAGLVHAPLGDYVLIEVDFAREGGTLGAVTGERMVRAYRRATERGLPIAQIISSGGARLQEGYFALTQMTRTASAAAAHRAAGLMTASAFRSPTAGGIFASWGNTAEVRAASPGATLGFAGPRVVQTVTGAFPPATSHTAESALANGLIDAIVPEEEQLAWLERAIGVRAGAPALATDHAGPAFAGAAATAWDAILASRAPERPSGADWASWITDSWIELRGPGERLRAGIAEIGDQRLIVIALDRDRSGGTLSLPRPEDYRLARRAVGLADRLRLPVLTIIDTPGADPSPSSEAGGIANEIAELLVALADLRSVSVSLVVGEAGSGGAVAFAHTDTLYMLEGSAFPVIGPEAGAAVIYRDPERAREFAEAIQPLPAQLVAFGFADAALPETVPEVRAAIAAALDPERIGRRNTRPDRAVEGAVGTE
ncbi:carboxyl transferase domain-containing protein [Microbacterium soli]|uniref:Acetyl-coenzyme A carboxylase carboxyl transferase subunits beta/alpha n=1 Tax=Microbacterium soli TaxID=446075 RepID=A0ABP7NHJ7_9MICO